MAGWETLSKTPPTPKKAATKKPVVQQQTPKPPISNPFTPIKEAKKKRGIKLGIYGDYGTGKTHFALTAPPPVFVIDTELGAAPLAHNFSDKEIYVRELFKPEEERIEQDEVDSFIEIREHIDWLQKHPPKNGTVVVDSVTDLWKLTQSYGKVKIFGLSPTDRLRYQFDWGVINNLYQKMIVNLLSIPCNLILTAKTQQVYQGANPTGKFQPYWQKNTAYYVDLLIRNKRTIEKGESHFESEIEKCRLTKDLMGKIYKDLKFETIQQELKKYVGE